MSKKPTEPATGTDRAPSIIQPIIDDLKGKTLPGCPLKTKSRHPAARCIHPQPAELDQDPGGGYNPDGTYPQT